MSWKDDPTNECPDCGENLMIHRGVVPLTATYYCPACSWCEVADGDRQEDAKADWAKKWVRNMEYDPKQTYYGGEPVPVEDFPEIPHAVELWEALKLWDMYYATAEAEGIYMLTDKMVKSAEQAMETCEPGRGEVIRQALKEINTPTGWAAFVLYIKRKLY